jgi:hypothetical protein
MQVQQVNQSSLYNDEIDNPKNQNVSRKLLETQAKVVNLWHTEQQQIVPAVQKTEEKQVTASQSLTAQNMSLQKWQAQQKALVTETEPAKKDVKAEPAEQPDVQINTEVPVKQDAKTEAQQEAAKPSFIDAEIAGVMQAYEAELAKGAGADSSKLYWMALSIVAYLMRQSGRDDEQYIIEMAVKIRENVKDVQGTYSNTLGTILTITSAIFSIAGGFMALAPLYGTQLLSLAASTVKTISDAAQPIGQVGNGIGGFGKLVDEKQAGERTFRQYVLDESKERRSTRRHAEEQAKSQETNAQRGLEDLIRNLHQAIQHTLSSSQ